MHLHCLGVNHRSANVSIRENLALSPDDCQAFWAELANHCSHVELVILSTCNRVEIYVNAPSIIWQELEACLAKSTGVNLSEIQSIFYRLIDEQVISHLFRVSAGLDSMVLGEPQILGQIKEAYEIALDQKSVGKALSKLFQSAIHTGKRIRAETAVGHKSISVSSLAAKLAQQVVRDLNTAKIALLGAGEMAELAVEALRKRGANTFTVISRTISSACDLANRWEGQASAIDKLDGILEDTDILISSTSAPHTLIHKSMIEKVMSTRPDRPLVIIDIAVPRDVAGDVDELENVSVYDIDHLNQGVEQSLGERAAEIPKVEEIIDKEYLIFKKYWKTLKVEPVIKEIRKQAEMIRQQEFKKTLKLLPDLNQTEQEQIKHLTESIIQKFLHTPTIRLRQEAQGEEIEKYAEAVSSLFGLDAAGD